jgi:hypothetical protein
MKRKASYHPLVQLREELGFSEDGYLRSHGWKQTSNTPGCLWLWEKATTIAIPCDEVEKVAQSVVFDYAFRKLVEPRRLLRATMDDEGEECSHCGSSAAATSIGLRVAGAGRW